jgi:cobyrinic acid a,c-diamide synthase
MIAAAHKSSGKTVVSVGLAAAICTAGENIGTFKKGPDYIDPMWLSAASGAPCYNLDFNAMRRDEIAHLFQSRAQANTLSLVEANKGLFDGVNPDGSDSNAELAKLLGLPVILVIDTMGMTRGIAPLLLGYCAFDADVRIKGVILNKVGGARHEGKLRTAVETFTDLVVVGSVWRDPALSIGERHLGLTTPAEIAHKEELIAGFGDIIARSVDLDAVRVIAAGAPELAPANKGAGQPSSAGRGLRIGIARDAAFAFYYADDLQAFEQSGATLVPIDMINDKALPDIDGLFIGGGFPEIQMAKLAANSDMRHHLKAALGNGLPCYAECGGLMYLCDSLTWNGETHEMVAAISGDVVMHKRPRGRGYVVFTARDTHPWADAGTSTNAHEFHYASLENLPRETCFARDLSRGAGIDGRHDAIVQGNTVAGFCHLRNAADTPWVADFLGFVRLCKTGGRKARAGQSVPG